jgi:hypothetical protein
VALVVLVAGCGSVAVTDELLAARGLRGERGGSLARVSRSLELSGPLNGVYSSLARTVRTPTKALFVPRVRTDMNKHFEDTRYYLKRASETAKKGIEEELEPVEERVRELAGKEEKPEPGRLEEIREDLSEIQERAEGEAKEAIGDARERLRELRD